MNSSRWATQNRARETMVCGGGEPRRILKYMHAYHMSQIAASSSSRFMLLDSLSLTNPLWRWWWRLNNINRSAQVHIILAEKGSCHWRCWKQWFTDSLLPLFFKPIDPHSWEPLLIRDIFYLQVNQQRASFYVLQICSQLYHLRVWRLSI